ncbi:MAG: GH3 auxin-responsive promoter family protein [Patescibacteria group bacterium]|nr:GH3 auxin-responsive promoter family protein [Patescibacteria group bacterium]
MFRKFSLPNLAFSRRRKSLHYSEKNPLLVQNKVFHYLIKQGRRTEWGKKYNYNNIQNPGDFQVAVPISTYEDIQPYIERLLRGENYLLWPEKIKYFSKSSGTTGSKSKYIPVSSIALKNNHYRGGRSLFASYFAQNLDSKLLMGQNFALGGSRQFSEIGADKYIADVSVILMKNLPWWARLRRSPKFSVACMTEWEEKLTQIAEIIAYQNIVSLSGVPSWNLVLAKKILELTGKKNLREVWPNLELFTHGGTSFEAYRSQFEALIPGPGMNYMEVYNASEGFFAFQDNLSRSDMLLFLNGGIFYEFVTIDELGKSIPKVLILAEVELGKNYALLISTNAGLWRYLIGDTIKFTSIKPYRIIITGRTKSFINACGEEVVVENADRAVKAACDACSAEVREYSAAPLFNESEGAARHQWLFEFAKRPDNEKKFIEVLDNTLMSLNSDYEAKRYKDLNLAPPLLVVAKHDLFYCWLKEKKRLGGQAKVPRLSNDRKIMSELLALNS